MSCFSTARDKKIEALRRETRVITLEQRQELKNPLGTLIKGSPKDTMKELAAKIRNERPVLVVSVGDEVSRNMLKYGIQPNVMIVDSRIMRKETKPIEATGFDIVKVRNPAGTLTPEAWQAVQESFRKRRPTRILVDGEEDLFTLVTIVEAPEKALIIYGQPHEGIVVTRVDKNAKQRVSRIIRAMQPLPQS